MTSPCAATTLATFHHYVERIDAVVEKIAALPNARTLLAQKAIPDSFTAARQLGIALYFAARGVYRVAGMDMPPFPKDFEAQTLRALAADLRHALGHVAPSDLNEEKVAHKAGFAELAQEPLDYMIRFALPNMIFHFSMGYAALRAAGAPLGKADFDGLHAYPDGFSF